VLELVYCLVAFCFALRFVAAIAIVVVIILQMRLFVVVVLARALKACPCGNLLLELVTKVVSGIIKAMLVKGQHDFITLKLN